VDIQGKKVLILGGYGLVGTAVCRKLMPYRPSRIVVASLRKDQALAAVAQLKAEFPESKTEFLPAWGDLLLRAEWQGDQVDTHPRVAVLAEAATRRQLVADTLDELSEEILTSSLLFQLVMGERPGFGDQAAEIVIDCVNTATAVAYQNIYQTARQLEGMIDRHEQVDWPEEVERLLASLYVPQLVRHTQILYEALLRAGAQAYIKVGTSGTGGMGLNIPYTHGEEKPSRVLLSKSAVAGAQTMLIFLLARTPGGPQIVKEIKPTAAIAWKEIGYGPIHGGGREVQLYDCPPAQAYSLEDEGTRSATGDFGVEVEGVLESAYIDTGENGLFALGEFTAITTLGQMEFVTPEEIAHNVVTELRGGNSGYDVIAGLDATVMGPSYRAGFMRQAALNRMRQLEQEQGTDSVAFEQLGPPRLSKLLFEAYLLKRVGEDMAQVIDRPVEDLAGELETLISQDAPLRQQILSIGIPILLPDGKRLLRGPVCKSADAENGWVDLTPANLGLWQNRLRALHQEIGNVLAGGTSSSPDRSYPSTLEWVQDGRFDVGEIVGWIFIHEESGRRGKY
jgi:NAD(P)-dependent dehydrogenase (short-subunit alcohol dehydrogenase family)